MTGLVTALKLLIIPIVLEYADAHIPLAHIAASLACQVFN